MEDLFVLVVDDESLIGLMIEDALHEGGFKTVLVGSAEHAMPLITAEPEKFCALVTDINLGPRRLRGWEVARKARELQPAIPVVYVTGDSGDEWSANGVPNSMLVPKPFVAAQILAAVAELMNHNVSSK